MKRDKHEEKQKEILEAAFDIWGADRYRNTSMSELAAALDITKQAIYRYFSGKEKLEQAMEERAVEIYDAYTTAQLERMAGCGEDDFAREYVESNIKLIRKYGKYVGFLSYRYRNETEELGITKERMNDFCDLARERAGIPPVGMRYLNALVMLVVRSNNDGPSQSDGWEIAWEEGFATDLAKRAPDYDRVLTDASRVDFSLFEADPLMNAVFEAVIEEAGSDVSLGKIAKKAGLTKSSLYNYWPSKEAMLTDVLDRQITLYSQLFGEFSEKYTDPSDRLFSYMAFTKSFLRRSPEILNFLQRVMSFGIRFPKKPKSVEERFVRPLDIILDADLIDLRGYTAEQFLGLVNLASVIEIKHHLVEGSARIRIEQAIKDLYRLISGGISALRRTI